MLEKNIKCIYAFANGFSNAVAAIVGYSLGYGDGHKAKEEGDYLMTLATAMSVVCLIFIYLVRLFCPNL